MGCLVFPDHYTRKTFRKKGKHPQEFELDAHHAVAELKKRGGIEVISLNDFNKLFSLEPSKFSEPDRKITVTAVWPEEINLGRYQEDANDPNSLITVIKVKFGREYRDHRGVGVDSRIGEKSLVFFSGAVQNLGPFDREQRLRYTESRYTVWNSKTKELGHIDRFGDHDGDMYGEFVPESKMEHPANYYGIEK